MSSGRLSLQASAIVNGRRRPGVFPRVSLFFTGIVTFYLRVKNLGVEISYTEIEMICQDLKAGQKKMHLRVFYP